ncbi:hypothetical protein A2U01_0093889, partial [Trifolium medium]|nr:hypothetical protein [Trifolium medium]
AAESTELWPEFLVAAPRESAPVWRRTRSAMNKLNPLLNYRF